MDNNIKKKKKNFLAKLGRFFKGFRFYAKTRDLSDPFGDRADEDGYGSKTAHEFGIKITF